MESKIEKPMILIASSKDGDANMDKRKLEDEYKVISDLSGFVNLRDMYEAEATVRTKKRKSPKRRRKKIECNAQERVSVCEFFALSSLFLFHSSGSFFYLIFEKQGAKILR